MESGRSLYNNIVAWVNDFKITPEVQDFQNPVSPQIPKKKQQYFQEFKKNQLAAIVCSIVYCCFDLK